MPPPPPRRLHCDAITASTATVADSLSQIDKQHSFSCPKGKLVRNFKHLNLDSRVITDEATEKRKLKGMKGKEAEKEDRLHLVEMIGWFTESWITPGNRITFRKMQAKLEVERIEIAKVAELEAQRKAAEEAAEKKSL